MKQFRLNGKPYPLATCWADLSAAQVLALAPYLYAQPEQGGVKLKVLRIVCPQLPARKLALLTSSQRFDLCQEVAWIWTEELGASAVDHFHHRGRIYLLPAPNLEDAVALEYAMASIYFRSFAHPQRANPKALDQLVATLCRPERAGLNVADPNWDGQRRERFNGKIAEARAGELADLPMATKIVVLQHFLAAQRFIHRGYQALYKKAGPVVPTPGAPTPVSDGSEVLEMIHALAERGTYGTYEETAYTGIHTLFYNLNKQAVRRREEE